MKQKYFIAAALLVVAIVCLGILWFMQPLVVPPEHAAPTPTPPKVETPKVVSPQAIAPPLAPKPGVNPVTAKAIPSTPAPDPNPDPQADLKTAIPDIARLFRANDRLQFFQTYTPPDEWAKVGTALTRRLLQIQADHDQNPDLKAKSQKTDEVLAQAYEALATQTPTYNAAGDEATYTLQLNSSTGLTTTQPATFVKINGKWYFKQPDAP